MNKLRQHINTEILPHVSKPSRYIGGELNSIVKPESEVDFRIALVFPDTYEIGMSHLGLPILYEILNRQKNIQAERVFSPWTDMEELMRQRSIPMFSHETTTPLGDFDVVGFSLQYELSYTNILTMLNLSGIPLLASERTEEHPLIIAGGPCAFNPEPLADFIDAFLIGDGEDAVLEMVEAIRSSPKNREKQLQRLAEIAGVYVPRFYETEELANGTIVLKGAGADVLIKKRALSDLSGAVYPTRAILPYPPAIHGRIKLEVLRGCTQGCRFCQAGMIYRPLRERSLETLGRLLEQSIDNTGHDEATLLSLSTCDYSAIYNLVKQSVDIGAERHVAVSFPSTRIDSFSTDLAAMVQSVKKTGLTFAPEAGTGRLRRIINKPLSTEDFLAKIEEVFARGWNLVKLYFMIGLPTETDEDVIAIADLVRQALERARGAARNREDSPRRGVNVNVAVSTFVPKSHTPFQWARQIGIEETEAKQRLLMKNTGGRGVNLKRHKARSSFLEGVFSRGDRRLGKVLLNAYKRGCRFDAWDDKFNFQAWFDSFAECDIDPNAYLRERNTDEVLPWDHISSLIEKRFFINEWRKALAGQITPDCRRAKCHLCGVVREDKCFCVNMKKTFRQGRKLDDTNIIIPERKPAKKSVQKIRMRFAKMGALRYISHLEMNTVLTRAFRRAKLPVAFTQGFSPHPKVSYSQPTSVGIESRAEFADIELHTAITPEELITKLNIVLPDGFSVLEADEIPLKTPHLASQIVQSVYRVEVSRLFGDETFTPTSIREECQTRIQELMAKTEAWIERVRENKRERINVRNFIEEIRIIASEDDTPILEMRLQDSNEGKGRAYEVLQALFNRPMEDLLELVVCKMDSLVLRDGRLVSPMG